MVMTEEIERRVQQADAARSATRAAAARQVGELAQRQAVLAEQLADVERALGDVLTAVRDVMDVDELAAFTDLPVADLARWRDARASRKSTRPARKRLVKAGDTGSARSARTTRPTPAASDVVEPDTGTASVEDTVARSPADVA